MRASASLGEPPSSPSIRASSTWRPARRSPATGGGASSAVAACLTLGGVRVSRHQAAPSRRAAEPRRLEVDGADRHPDAARDGRSRRAATSRCCSTGRPPTSSASAPDRASSSRVQAAGVRRRLRPARRTRRHAAAARRRRGAASPAAARRRRPPAPPRRCWPGLEPDARLRLGPVAADAPGRLERARPWRAASRSSCSVDASSWARWSGPARRRAARSAGARRGPPSFDRRAGRGRAAHRRLSLLSARASPCVDPEGAARRARAPSRSALGTRSLTARDRCQRRPQAPLLRSLRRPGRHGRPGRGAHRRRRASPPCSCWAASRPRSRPAPGSSAPRLAAGPRPGAARRLPAAAGPPAGAARRSGVATTSRFYADAAARRRPRRTRPTASRSGSRTAPAHGLLVLVVYAIVAPAAFLALSLRLALPAIAVLLAALGFGLTIDDSPTACSGCRWPSSCFAGRCSRLSRSLQRSAGVSATPSPALVTGIVAAVLALSLLGTTSVAAGAPLEDWRTWGIAGTGDARLGFDWMQNYPRLLDPSRPRAGDAGELAVASYWRANALTPSTARAGSHGSSYMGPSLTGSATAVVTLHAPGGPRSPAGGWSPSSSRSTPCTPTISSSAGARERDRWTREGPTRINTRRRCSSTARSGPRCATPRPPSCRRSSPRDLVGRGHAYPADVVLAPPSALPAVTSLPA